MKKLTTLIAGVFLISASLSYSEQTCTFVKKDPKDPKGGLDEVMVQGFTLKLSKKKKKATIKDFQLGAIKGYLHDNESWPESDTGKLNPKYHEHSKIARHENYSQYKGFGEILGNTTLHTFELLVDKDDHARLVITTNDGNYTEELFNCD